MLITLSNAIDLYLDDAKTRCEPSTVAHYSKRFTSFRKALGHKRLDELTIADIKAHLDFASRWPDGRDKAPDTIRSNVVAWEQLQKWLIESEILPAPVTPKKLTKPGGRKREILPTKEETKAILDKAPADFRPIYLALRLTGARPGELCKAQIEQLDRTAGEIVLAKHKTARKTGRPRRIPVGHPSLVAILNAQIGDRTTGNIFLRDNGKPWEPTVISAVYRAARLAAGLRKGLVAYLARHEHATTLYSVLGDIKAVADALGHSNISTTMRYTRFNLKQAQQNQRLFDDSLE